MKSLVSNIRYGINKFNMQTRINDPASTFSLDFVTPQAPNQFYTGNSIAFSIGGSAMASGINVVKGFIQKIKRNNKAGNQIYNISGRDIGFYLTKQPFYWAPTIDSPYTYETRFIIDQILANTGITLGRGVALSTSIEFSTNGDDPHRFCGAFKTKKDALDQLFSQYAHIAGKKRVRWFIDMGGNLNWFEVGGRDIGNEFFFFDDTANVIDFEIEENAENIVNDLSGFGCDESSVFAHRQVQESINRFGLQIGETIRDSKYTTIDEIVERLVEELNQKAWPIYTAKVNIAKYHDIQPGVQVMFPDDPTYSDLKFTVVDKQVQGTPANHITTINLTTDTSSISIVNQFDIISAMINESVINVLPRRSVVIEKSEDGKFALVRPYGSNNVIFTRLA